MQLQGLSINGNDRAVLDDAILKYGDDIQDIIDNMQVEYKASYKCDHYDCFGGSYKCTCDGNCDGCSGRRN